MKNIIRLSMFIIAIITTGMKAQELAPYIKVADLTSTMPEAINQITRALTNNNFEILGTYNPADNADLGVIVFTRTDLKNTVIKVKDRGALAAALKIGLVKKGDIITVSYVNPKYLFNAYLRKETPNYSNILNQINTDVKTSMANIGQDFTGFGGGITAEKLWKYHYKIMMPYFSDPVDLKTFNSFEEGLKIISANLESGKNGTKLVYKIIFKENNVAVFGVGLLDKNDGESVFLPKIGEDNIAAMPYEIILQNNTASMLHGKYRLALSWPELSMGTFMKIMSTPGNIEDMLQGLTEMDLNN